MFPDHTIQAAIQEQFRVLAALILRETRATFGTSQIGYLWAIITPAASIAILVAIFSAIDRHPPFGASLAAFFATGVLTLELFQKLSSSLMKVFEANQALLTYPLVKETDVLFARAILIGATYMLIISLFYVFLAAVGMGDAPAHPEQLLMAFAVTFMLGLGFGACNAVVASLWKSWPNILGILTRPLFFLSGIFFVPSYMPSQLIEWLEWNPVLHCIEWMRNGYYSNYDSMILDKSYVIAFALILTLVGLAGERMTRIYRGR